MKHRFLFIIFACLASLSLGWCQVYFTPRDDIKLYLIQLISEERDSIDAAVYMLTDKAIAQALVQAYVRGVKVRIILDQISMGEKYGKGVYLQNNGITIFVHHPIRGTSFFSPIMHHKFFVFGHNSRLRCALAWTGSFNCTACASRLHDENVIVTDEVNVIAQYRQCFILLMNRLIGQLSV